jgi:hypothetical protein
MLAKLFPLLSFSLAVVQVVQLRHQASQSPWVGAVMAAAGMQSHWLADRAKAASRIQVEVVLQLQPMSPELGSRNLEPRADRVSWSCDMRNQHLLRAPRRSTHTHQVARHIPLLSSKVLARVAGRFHQVWPQLMFSPSGVAVAAELGSVAVAVAVVSLTSPV